MAARVEVSAGKDAFVFVHGYRSTFEKAVLRTAQLHKDLKFEGAPILYSWPSGGQGKQFVPDLEMAQWSVKQLKGFLEELVTMSGAKKVHLIAHSLGARALLYALDSVSDQAESGRFQQIVLASPEIDAATVEGLAHAIRGSVERLTIYASKKDIALLASQIFFWQDRRAGTFVVVPDVDTIDYTEVDGHSFGDNPWVMNDIKQLLDVGTPPDNRSFLERRSLEGLVYWAFPATLVGPPP